MSAYPDWLPVEQWEGFVEMRKKQKKPMTNRAIHLAFGTLDKLRAQGQDIAAVIDQSTMNCWSGLFAVVERRGNERNTNTNRSNFPSLGKHGQATANNLQDWLEDYE